MAHGYLYLSSQACGPGRWVTGPVDVVWPMDICRHSSLIWTLETYIRKSFLPTQCMLDTNVHPRVTSGLDDLVSDRDESCIRLIASHH